MAAKKKTKKAAPKKAAKVVKMKPKAKAVKKKTARPRSQVLPGMEQVRNTRMIRILESMYELRTEAARNQAEQDDLIQQGTDEMIREKRSSYRHAKMEFLVSTPGVKARVRMLKEAVTEVPAADPPADDAGVTEDEVGDESADEGKAAEA